MTPEDASDVIALNEAVVHTTSPMDIDRFKVLYALSDLKLIAQVNGDVVAFVMGIASDSSYDNGNYDWFSERLKRFLYVDRVVVSDRCRGMGVGRLLYSQIHDWAVRSRLLTVCAEMNLNPPNHQSLRFHRNAGFVQIGTRMLENGKLVSMQIRSISEDSETT
ncbi:Acetyltransferase (GNAT) family protein [Mariniblastus fucicola]|uniref:Acetyltransferase (GNAT) family protein n=2 Tax=Mariniblastus fucicola TaxID=980251 RepID=A0A5B9PF76_9BACT|nr:Acetyltransferase (GNAT) family protein [Mariniblastus fucicola]